MVDWTELSLLQQSLSGRRISDLFAADDVRAEAFSVALDDMRFDYSKTQLDAEIRTALCDLCDAADLGGKRAAMFAGDKINETEDRAVLHTALRADASASVIVDGEDVIPDVQETLARMVAFAEAVRSGAHSGAGGAIEDVVNIGIGGSHLGPAMAVRALSPYADGPRCHFVSNVDGADISDVLAGLDPKRTLLIIASKTFTTIETMTNAQTARDWLVAGGGDPARQSVALSSALDKTGQFGIPDAQVFGFEDWVGGRYSLWGLIGLSIMLAVGGADFAAVISGAPGTGQHFWGASWNGNKTVKMGLVVIWHQHICSAG
ncbi:MAG: glucose-6-phosphate isomerase, partial [Arenibacterium sp.]